MTKLILDKQRVQSTPDCAMHIKPFRLCGVFFPSFSSVCVCVYVQIFRQWKTNTVALCYAIQISFLIIIYTMYNAVLRRWILKMMNTHSPTTNWMDNGTNYESPLSSLVCIMQTESHIYFAMMILKWAHSRFSLDWIGLEWFGSGLNGFDCYLCHFHLSRYRIIFDFM